LYTYSQVKDLKMKLKPVPPSVCLTILAATQLFVLATPAERAPRRIEVTAQRFQFTPAEITLKKGEPVVLVLNSTDTAHGLQFKELGLETKIHKGQPSEMAFTPDKTGTFVGHCSVFCGSGHGSMTLTLHIVE
jgi:cytochrome c oxidase subunit II